MLNQAKRCSNRQVRIAVAEVGFDPSIGYLHVCQPGRQALLYDLMEPHRPEVERVMLTVVRSQTFTPRDFGDRLEGSVQTASEIGETTRVRYMPGSGVPASPPSAVAALSPSQSVESCQLSFLTK